MESKNSAIHSIVVNLIHDVSGSVYLCSVAQDRLSAKQLDCVFRTKAAVQHDAMFASHDRNTLGLLCVGF